MDMERETRVRKDNEKKVTKRNKQKMTERERQREPKRKLDKRQEGRYSVSNEWCGYLKHFAKSLFPNLSSLSPSLSLSLSLSHPLSLSRFQGSRGVYIHTIAIILGII